METWKPIPGFDGYEASDLGRVRSVDHVTQQLSRSGAVYYRCTRGKIRALTPNRDGHLIINFGRVFGTQYVHQLVMLAFVGPPPNGCECCHNDENPSNNQLGNLRYDTRLGNMADRILYNRQAKGERNGMAVLSTDDVMTIRTSQLRLKDLSEKYGVSISQISRIKLKQNWGWVDG